jgi:3-phosphoshikimate 1-carboxyvinyltransferase
MFTTQATDTEVTFSSFIPHGAVNAPASKSYAQRLLALSLVAPGKNVFEGYTPCDDTERALDAVRKLGARATLVGETLSVTSGKAGTDTTELYFGGSATSMRIFTGVSTVTPGTKLITGSEQLARRPVAPLVSALRRLGASIETSGGGLPLIVHGTGLRGGSVNTEATISSQFASSIMIAATKADNDVEILQQGGGSKGYVSMTAEAIRLFGGHISLNEDGSKILVKPSSLRPVRTRIEGDFSSAAFALVAGAIAGEVEVCNLNPYSLQPDRSLIEIIRGAGCEVKVSEAAVKVSGSKLEPFEVSVDDSPDLAPVLAVLAAYAKGKSTIGGIERLRFKESDRIGSITRMLASLGVESFTNGKTITVTGGAVEGGTVDAEEDHRIALAASIAAVSSHKPVRVLGFECHTKSYPRFLDDYRALGGKATVRGNQQGGS